MSTLERRDGRARLGGVALDRALAALQRLEPAAHAAYVYDLDALDERVRRLRDAFASVPVLAGYAVKANGLPALLERLSAAELAADTGSLGELAMAEAAGFGATRRILNGNGRTREEAEWVASHGVHSVNADHVDELDLLERAAATADARVRVALRVNPGIEIGGHHYIATGHGEAKFGVTAAEALAAWGARARWPHLRVDGIHMHLGSQIMDLASLEQGLAKALELADESARRGAPLGLVNLGGGFGLDYSDQGREFPLERWAATLAARGAGRALEWAIEPGRWLVGPVGVIVAEVLHVKPRDGRRFVVLAAGMNDLIRPALYQAVHRIEPVAPRAGAVAPAAVVGPVCESSDTFADEVPLPPVEAGDLIVIHDAGAYGASMASNYNGRGRLAEVVIGGGRAWRARAGETPRDLLARRDATPLPPDVLPAEVPPPTTRE
jgi:diaminopimelate decarboxylase